MKERRERSQVASYRRDAAAVFLRTHEAHGSLSNMAAGFPLDVNGLRFRTSEALYQACRFPHMPDVQRLILDEQSPMSAKMKSKPFRKDSRPDWDQVRIPIMRWCLRVKLLQNWETFAAALIATGHLPIVEESRRDAFWGAKPLGEVLEGENHLGKLLTHLRDELLARRISKLDVVEPPRIEDFLLDGRPVEPIRIAGPPDPVPMNFRTTPLGIVCWESGCNTFIQVPGGMSDETAYAKHWQRAHLGKGPEKTG